MTDRPILFSTPMVRALLDGRKTMTRRLAWSSRQPSTSNRIQYSRRWDGSTIWQKVQPGDRLWVRETFALPDAGRSAVRRQGLSAVHYYADEGVRCGRMRQYDRKKEPSIHMPRWASRLTLVVTETKMEPLLDISEEDAQAEGFEDSQLNDGFGPRDFGGGYTIESPGTFASAGGMFQIAWAKLHPDWDGYSSPEVVALTLTVHKTNIDQMEAA